MARPRKEGLDYFPHDTDAVNDEKIEALRALYGNDGYAFYFILLERIYRTNNLELNISDAEMCQILARKIGVSEEKFNQMLETAIRWNCFDREMFEKKGILTSNGIKKRAAIVLEKRLKMREKYQQGKGRISASGTGEETTAEMRQSKVKKSKEKKIDHSNENVDIKTTVVVSNEGVQGGDDQNSAAEEVRQKIVNELEKAGILTPSAFEIETLEYWIKQGIESEAVIFAIHKAAKANRRRVDYIEGILRNWFNAGVRTLKQAEAESLKSQKYPKEIPRQIPELPML